MASSHPIYSLQCDISGCAYDVRCNDYPLLISRRALPVTIDVPLNLAIWNGLNEITVHIQSPAGGVFDEDTELTMVVFLRNENEKRGNRQEVSRFACSFDDRAIPKTTAKTTKLNGGFLFTQQVSLEVPFPDPQWRRNIVPPARENVRLDLLKEYQRFHEMLSRKDLNGVLSLLHFRTMETASALYESPANREAELRSQYSKLFASSESRLADLRSDTTLHSYGDGRLVRLELSNGESPIYYVLTNLNVAQYIPLMFTKTGAGQWIVIR